jgi:hypothetical protein
MDHRQLLYQRRGQAVKWRVMKRRIEILKGVTGLGDPDLLPRLAYGLNRSGSPSSAACTRSRRPFWPGRSLLPRVSCSRR